VALILSVTGLYAVNTVAQRTQEIGIRMAMGANTFDVIGLVVGQGMKLTAVGLGIGIGLSIIFNRLLSDLLFGISPTDFTTLCLITLLVAAVTLASLLFPAYRASKINPTTALRNE
jgi:putative ABC transport system permease protein